jgi:hypothetical protein
MNTIIHYFGYVLVIANMLSMALVIFPFYRKAKFATIQKLGYKLWREQMVTALEFAVGIAMIQLF